MVVAFHASGWVGADAGPVETRLLAHLNLGVPLFFAISGFLLYRPFVAARVGAGPQVRFLQYGRRRLLRIVPAYWVALAILTILPTAFAVAHRPLVFFGFIQSYPPALAGLKCTPLTGPGSRCGLPQAWSLSVEMTFYLLLPGYVALVSRLSRGKARRRVLTVDALILAALGALALVGDGLWKANHPTSIAMTLANPLGIGGTFVWFAFGMILAIASVGSEGIARPRRLRFSAELAWALGIGSYLLICFALPITNLPQGISSSQRVIEWGLFGVVAACLIAPAIFGEEQGPVRRLLSSPTLRWLGLISYGIFLWHLAILDLVLSHNGVVRAVPGNTLVTAFILTLIGSVACGALSYYVVELPFLRRKESSSKRHQSASAKQPLSIRVRSRKVWTGAAVAAVLVAVLAVEAIRAGDPPRWTVLPQASLLAATRAPSSQPVGTPNNLRAVAAAGPNDAWAVGSYTDQRNVTWPLTEHWNGSKWSPVAAEPGGVSSTFTAVAAIGPNDVWAVGTFMDQQHVTWPLSEHWDGRAWHTELPVKGGTSSALSGVAMLGPDDVWAVGSYRGVDGVVWPMAEHWDGWTWTMTSSIQGGTSSYFTSVTVMRPGDVWAAGAYKDSSGRYRPLAERWDGSRWSVTPALLGGASSYFSAITATSRNDVWAVGAYQDSGGAPWPLVEHWNGQSWSVTDRGDRSGDRGVPLPASLAPAGRGVSGSFDAVTAFGADDLWVVGFYTDHTGTDHPFAERWNGTSWWVTTAPTSGTTSQLDAAAAIARDKVLAVGSSRNSSGVTRPLIEGWTSPG